MSKKTKDDPVQSVTIDLAENGFIVTVSRKRTDFISFLKPRKESTYVAESNQTLTELIGNLCEQVKDKQKCL